MAAKRSKGGCKKKGAGGGTKQKRGTPRNSQKCEDAPAQSPYDRVAFVRPFWESLSQEERVKLLTVSLDDIRSRAQQHAEKVKALGEKKAVSDPQNPLGKIEPQVQEILEEGLRRIGEQSTWKVWRWEAAGEPYTDAEAFRKDAEEEHIVEELRKLLPRDEGKATEKPAEAALRERMTNLLGQIQAQLQNAQDAWRKGQRNTQDQVETVVRDGNIDLVIAILEALQQEHHCLYQTILTPVTEFICDHLPMKNRKSSRTELFFEDLEKLPPEEIARLYEWLTEKVDSLCARLKPDPKEDEVEEEQSVGDIDLFSLTPNGVALTVNPKWLQHLEERRLSDEGQPRKVKEGEDPYRIGLVLEWVFGSIVSTAEKARDGAKRPLGPWEPAISQAHGNLVAALKDQQDLEARSANAKELLKAMVTSRKDAEALEARFNVILPGTPAGQNVSQQTEVLSGELILRVLKREELLTRAKLHVLQYERMMGDSQLKSLRAELMQGEPELERLKRELEEVKNTPRGLEGTFRTVAEKERHRAQLADSLLEEQLEVQSAFREQGAKLQGIYDKRQRTEIEMAKRDQEINQLKSWQLSVNSLIARFETILGKNGLPGDVEESGSKTDEQVDGANPSTVKKVDPLGLIQLRQTFNRDYRKQLYCDKDDHQFFNCIKSELKQIERRLEDGKVVLQHLEMFLVNVACDDPGSCIGGVLILPILQDRLDKKAMEFATHKASLAEEEILRMEMENNEKVSAEVEKKQKQKRKLKDKARLAKERKAAEQKAREEAEWARVKEQQTRERERLEAEKIRKEKELERIKKEEEELIEKRRLELLQEENGYWKMRMEASEVVVPEDESVMTRSDEGVSGEEDNFQSVPSTRRRAQDWRQQPAQGLHRHGETCSSGSGGHNWNGGSGGLNRGGVPHHRRHRSADLESLNRRRPLSARLQPSDCQGFRNAPRGGSNRQPLTARTVQSGRQPRGDLHAAANSGSSRGLPGRTQSLPAPAATSQQQTISDRTVPIISPFAQSEVNESCRSAAQPPVVESTNTDTAGQRAVESETAVATVPSAAWVKGSIPPEVLGNSKGEEASKSVTDDAKSKSFAGVNGESRACSEFGQIDSITSLETPDAVEIESHSVQSESENLQQNADVPDDVSPQQALQIKTAPLRNSEVDNSTPERTSASPLHGHDNASRTFKKFVGNGVQMFHVMKSAPGLKEDKGDPVVAQNNPPESCEHEDADDALFDAAYQTDEDANTPEHSVPPGPVLVPPVGPPPFTMMGGPMEPVPGFHPGLFTHMRPVGPPMRHFVPMMGPPGLIRPPGLVPPVGSSAPPCTPSHPQGVGQEPVASTSPDSCSSPSASVPLQRRPPPQHALPPMYFFPSQMMQQGGPMMMPFMPLMPGQWFGFPMGPPQGPTFPPTGRDVKKFALRPNAKEFIPPSMLAEVSTSRLDPIADGSECSDHHESNVDLEAGVDSDAVLGSISEIESEFFNVEKATDGSDTEHIVEDSDSQNCATEFGNDIGSSFDVTSQNIASHGCDGERKILDATKVVARTIEQEA